MRKEALVLILLGLLVGLSLAQTPRVTLVWEKSIPEGVFKLALDEQDTLLPPEVTVVTLGAIAQGPHGPYRGAQRILKIDSTGAVREIVSKRSNDPVVLSSNGRFIGVNRWVYDPDFRNLPTPYVITPSGGRITLQGECGECEIAAIGNSGRVILGSKGLGYPGEMGQISTKRETLVFYNGQGHVVSEVPANGEKGKKLSSDGNYLVMRQRLSESDPMAMTLKLYDSQGRMLWGKDRSVGLAEASDVSENGIVADGYLRRAVSSDSMGGVRFFNRNGLLLGDVVLGKNIVVQNVSLDPDARYALVQSLWFSKGGWGSGPGGESLFLLRVDTHEIVWRRDFPERSREASKEFESAALFRDGRYVAALIGEGGYGKGERRYVTLINLLNSEVWRADVAAQGSVYISPTGRYFLVQSDALRLYRIEQ